MRDLLGLDRPSMCFWAAFCVLGLLVGFPLAAAYGKPHLGLAGGFLITYACWAGLALLMLALHGIDKLWFRLKARGQAR